jgi:hypothetical protein
MAAAMEESARTATGGVVMTARQDTAFLLGMLFLHDASHTSCEYNFLFYDDKPCVAMEAQ